MIERVENINRRSAWLCECECGTRKILKYCDLINGRSRSCGCLRKDLARERLITHGLTWHPLFRKWGDMKTRCYNPNARHYQYYGGRGIRICDEWLNDFKNFYYWAINTGWIQGRTIDRIDPNGNYEPSNCRWATVKEQNCNKRNNIVLTHEGKTKKLIDFCKELKVKRSVVVNRLNRGWKPEEALSGKRNYPR